jgi:hypothetical protein
MEDNKNRNHDQEDRDYKDAPTTTDFEKSRLNNDPNLGNTEEEKWEEDDLNRSIDDSLNISNPIDNPDDDFEGNSIIDDIDYNPDLEEESDIDIDDEDLNDESDFNEPDIEDEDEEDEEEDEINNENSDLDDDFTNRKN